MHIYPPEMALPSVGQRVTLPKGPLNVGKADLRAGQFRAIGVCGASDPRPFTHLLPCQKFPTFWPKFLPVVNRVAVRSPRRLTVNQADVRNLGNEIAISKTSGFVGPTITRRVSRWASQPLQQLIPRSSRKPEEETFLPRLFLSAFISS